MTFKFDNDREAFLSVLAVVVGADQMGTLQERDFLFGEVRALPLFGGADRAEFAALVARVTETVCPVCTGDDGAIAPAKVDELLTDVRAMLSPEQCKSLVQVSEALCAVDGVDDAEAELMVRVRGALI
jgi:hypothetical protein